MKNITMKVACLGVIALTIGSYASAEIRPGAVSLRLADGPIFFAQKRQIENTAAPTIELGYQFNDKWGMKVGTSVINTNTKGVDSDAGVHGFIYTVDGVYQISSFGHFEPYVLGGVGVTSINTPDSTDPNNQTNVNAGIGSHFFIDPSISLNAEAKDLYVMSGGKNDLMLTAGVTFYFGGESEAAQPVLYKGVKN